MTVVLNDASYLFPGFRRSLEAGLDIARRESIGVYIFESWRSPKRQELMFQQQKSKARAYQSWHQYGLAVDLAFKVNNQWSWEGPWQRIGVIMEQIGIEWGYRFKSFPEMGHFQMSFGLSLNIAQQLYLDGGIFTLWDYLREDIKVKQVSA